MMPHNFTYKYAYVSDDGTNYTLGEDVSGQVPSQTTYKCDFGSDPCTISTDTPKDENNQILMEDGTSEDGDGCAGAAGGVPSRSLSRRGRAAPRPGAFLRGSRGRAWAARRNCEVERPSRTQIAER